MNTEKLIDRIKAVVKKYGLHNPQLNTLRELYELYRTQRDPIAQTLLLHEITNLEKEPTPNDNFNRDPLNHSHHPTVH